MAEAVREEEARATPCARERKAARRRDVAIPGVVDDEHVGIHVGDRLRQLEFFPAMAEAALEALLHRLANRFGDAEAAREVARIALQRSGRRDEHGAHLASRAVEPGGRGGPAG